MFVENDLFGDGCSSSIAIALTAVDERCRVLVLMLGDQPGVTLGRPSRSCSPAGATARSPRARYDDGRGHPLAFARSMFDAARDRCTATRACGSCSTDTRREVVDVPVPGPIPLDVDTWEDYEAVKREAASASG